MLIGLIGQFFGLVVVDFVDVLRANFGGQRRAHFFQRLDRGMRFFGDFNQMPAVGGAHRLADFTHLQGVHGVLKGLDHFTGCHFAQIPALRFRAGIFRNGFGLIRKADFATGNVGTRREQLVFDFLDCRRIGIFRHGQQNVPHGANDGGLLLFLVSGVGILNFLFVHRHQGRQGFGRQLDVVHFDPIRLHKCGFVRFIVGAELRLRRGRHGGGNLGAIQRHHAHFTGLIAQSHQFIQLWRGDDAAFANGVF